MVTHSENDPDLLDGDRLLTPTEVAPYFRVDPKTVARWAAAGRFPDLPGGALGVITTFGGHRRIRASVVAGLIDGSLEWKGGDGGDQDR